MMITFNEFVSDVMSLTKECPKCWRKGQSVFNIVDAKYGVARDVQFIDNIDCFYNDEQIEPFLIAAYKRLIFNLLLKLKEDGLLNVYDNNENYYYVEWINLDNGEFYIKINNE